MAAKKSQDYTEVTLLPVPLGKKVSTLIDGEKMLQNYVTQGWRIHCCVPATNGITHALMYTLVK